MRDITDPPASQRQIRYLQAVAREGGYDAAALDNRAVQDYGCVSGALTRAQASELIAKIQDERRTYEDV